MGQQLYLSFRSHDVTEGHCGLAGPWGVGVRLAWGLPGLSRELGEVQPCGNTGPQGRTGSVPLLEPGAGLWGWAGEIIHYSVLCQEPCRAEDEGQSFLSS